MADRIALRSLVRVMQSPRYHLLNAKVRQQLADAIASGNTAAMERAIGRAAAALNVQRERIPSMNAGIAMAAQ